MIVIPSDAVVIYTVIIVITVIIIVVTILINKVQVRRQSVISFNVLKQSVSHA